MVIASLINVNTLGNNTSTAIQYNTGVNYVNPQSCFAYATSYIRNGFIIAVLAFAPAYFSCLAGQTIKGNVANFFIAITINGGGNTPDTLGFLAIEVVIVSIAVVAGIQLFSSGLNTISIYILFMSGISIIIWLTLSAINWDFFYPISNPINPIIKPIPFGNIIYMLLTLMYLIGSIDTIRIG
jgi:hypothetical protein